MQRKYSFVNINMYYFSWSYTSAVGAVQMWFEPNDVRVT